MITEDGWPSCTADQLDFSKIPGTDESVGLQRGIPNTVLKSFMGALNKYVEAAVDSRGGGQDEGGWTGTNSVPTSNHLGGTAFDYNWRDHPMGPKVPDPAAGWQWSEIVGGPEEGRVRELLRYYTYDGLQIVWWANDWTSPHDSMHFQMGYGTFGDPRVQKFIDECINPLTGLPRFFEDKGLQAVDLVPTLSELMGNTADTDYADLLTPWQNFLVVAECNTVNRIAMAGAEVGEESGGLHWMEEIASGAEYEGDIDLGNTQHGDGVRFKGRGPIQLTGRHNYTKFSQWAFDRGLCDTPTYYVDNPTEVSDYNIGFMAAAFFWTTHNLNSFADKMDVIGATKVINGGDHGLQDRQFRYSRAIQMGDRLLAFLDEESGWMSQVDADRLNKAIDKILGGGTMPDDWDSRGMFVPLGEPGTNVDDTVGMLLNIDGNAWNVVMIIGALLGVPRDVQAIRDNAAGNFPAESFVAKNPWLKARSMEFAEKLLPLCGLLNETFFGTEPADPQPKNLHEKKA